MGKMDLSSAGGPVYGYDSVSPQTVHTTARQTTLDCTQGHASRNINNDGDNAWNPYKTRFVLVHEKLKINNVLF